MPLFEIDRPLDTHFRPAPCQEGNCAAFERGWITVLAAASDMCEWARRSGRQYSERTEAGITTFTFPPGQQCFRGGHMEPLEREPIFRKVTRERTRELRFDQWVDTFNDTLVHLNQIRERG
jgi:hypothetical protein